MRLDCGVKSTSVAAVKVTGYSSPLTQLNALPPCTKSIQLSHNYYPVYTCIREWGFPVVTAA